MPEKVQGTVKWFSNRKGFGFVTPADGNADIFLHHSKIVSDADYKTLKDGFAVQFEIGTDENGKPFADHVTSADGTPCPGPEPRAERRQRGKNKKEGGEEKSGDEATSDEKDESNKNNKKKNDNNKNNGNDTTENKDGKGNNRGRNRSPKKNGKKPQQNKDGEQQNAPKQQKPKENVPPPVTWYSELDEAVQKSMQDRSIKIESGRAFVSIGDARLKLGTGAYAALAHTSALIAEGTYTCSKDGQVVATWKHVLKHDGSEWKVSTAEAENGALLAKFDLKDETVKPTGAEETPDTLWGEGKGDPKDVLEKNGFQMRKVSLHHSATQNRGRGGHGKRHRNRKPQKKGESKEGGAAPAAAPAT